MEYDTFAIGLTVGWIFGFFAASMYFAFQDKISKRKAAKIAQKGNVKAK